MRSYRSPLLALFISFSLQELRQHPWRNTAAVVSVMLGVALAYSVHLINASALDEFSQAVRSVEGKPDLELRSGSAIQSGLDHALLARLAHHPDVEMASPILEFSTTALSDPQGSVLPDKGQRRLAIRVVGMDALQVARIAPDLAPVPAAGEDRRVIFAADSVFLNASASSQLTGQQIALQVGLRLKLVRVAGSVAASGSPLVAMDIAAAQDLFDKPGQLSRVDVRLRAGVDAAAFVQRIQSAPDWPSGARLSQPGATQQRMTALSRAYRVNLTVLALVALFTGGFLVFSVVALGVSRRSREFALLGVLGMTGRQRLNLILLESGALGFLGSTMGIALGTALAALALRLLGGDLGGGFFSGATPELQWSGLTATAFAGLGVLAALTGAWWPALWTQQLPIAQTLKGLTSLQVKSNSAWIGASMLSLGAVLALVPPVFDIPLAAYLSVGAILLGGIVGLPWLIGKLLDRIAPLVARRALALLAVERARRVRESAAIAVSGVVASLSLAVALTVMVASFRSSVTVWLDTVLPADLYLRTAVGGAALETAYFDPAFVQGAADLPGVLRVGTQRSQQWLPDPANPPVTLIARPLTQPDADLPLVAPALPVPSGLTGIYVSEAMVDLHGVLLGTIYPPLADHFENRYRKMGQAVAPFFVAGVWRDYSRQFGTVALDQTEFQRLTGDQRVNDVALWLKDGTSIMDVQNNLRALANRLAHTPGGEAAQLLEFGSASEIRATSLRIFDRSFAVTYWLQAVAIGIGLFGVAASFSAQVLARRKEFGLLIHLGLTRRQVRQVVAMEGAAWTVVGAVAGIALGLAVSAILVHVVNPQSFHWTMDLTLPVARLLLLGTAVIVAGTATAYLAAKAAAGREAVLAVKEDW
ncbi:MAG: ABC transporter permease [Rhodoferax sp.]|nr:ABC transporter permease [Rhodoferax sp.]